MNEQNQTSKYAFELATYREGDRETLRYGTLAVTGKCEEHARRQIMNHLYKHGWLVKTMKLAQVA